MSDIRSNYVAVCKHGYSLGDMVQQDGSWFCVTEIIDEFTFRWVPSDPPAEEPCCICKSEPCKCGLLHHLEQVDEPISTDRLAELREKHREGIILVYGQDEPDHAFCCRQEFVSGLVRDISELLAMLEAKDSPDRGWMLRCDALLRDNKKLGVLLKSERQSNESFTEWAGRELGSLTADIDRLKAVPKTHIFKPGAFTPCKKIDGEFWVRLDDVVT